MSLRAAVLCGGNIAVLAASLTALEMSYRGLMYLRSCTSVCDGRTLSSPLSQDAYGTLRIATYDPVLGYAPRENLDVVVPRGLAPAWDGARVSTDEHGFRRNGESRSDDIASPAQTVLAVGDSFTFGDQVGNGETWPACLSEGPPALTVVNGGVFGYGAAQSLLRAERIMEDGVIRPAVLLVGILVGEGFERDALRYRSGFPKPAVVRLDGSTLGFAPPPTGRDTGAKFEDATGVPAIVTMARAVNNSSWVVRRLLSAGNFSHRVLMKRRSERHPDAASREEILQWTLQRLASFPVPALVVLQYGPETSPGVLAERVQIRTSLQQLRIASVDSFSAIHGEGIDKSLLYRSDGEHHSPLGNRMICSLIRRSPDFRRLVGQEIAR